MTNISVNFLTDEDVYLIKDFLSHKSKQAIRHSLDREELRPKASNEIYIASSKENVPGINFNENDLEVQPYPFFIYKIVPPEEEDSKWNLIPIQLPSGEQKILSVFNLLNNPIHPKQYVLIKKDMFGRWCIDGVPNLPESGVLTTNLDVGYGSIASVELDDGRMIQAQGWPNVKIQQPVSSGSGCVVQYARGKWYFMLLDC